MKLRTGEWLTALPLLRARALHDFAGSKMPGYEDAAALRWTDPDPPALVLFVSHRWQTVAEPDPQGRSLRALRSVLVAIDDLGRGLDPACDHPAPDLRRPAMLHASVIQYRRMAERFDGPRSLDDIAVFYDHSCLPQGPAPEDQRQLRAGLASLPAVLADPRVTLLALRSHGDDFEARAWCVAEANLSLSYERGRAWAMTFPLRLDLEARAPVVTFSALDRALAAWNRGARGCTRLTRRQFEDWIEIVQLCVDWHNEAREEAVERLHHTGSSADRSYLLYMNTAGLLSERRGTSVDLADLLGSAARSTGLRCTKGGDVVLASLLILGGLRWEQVSRSPSRLPTDETDDETDRWRECLRRFLAGRSLRATVTPGASQSLSQLPVFEFDEPAGAVADDRGGGALMGGAVPG